MGKASRKRQALSQAEKREASKPSSGQPAKAEDRGVSLIYKPVIHILLLGLLGFVIYSNTFQSPFQWDEADYIVGNPIVRDLGYFAEPSRAEGLPLHDSLKSRYIGYLTFALNYRLHGFHVVGYHVVNLAIHLINAVLVYFLVLLTLKTPFFAATGDSRAVDDSLFTVHDSRPIAFAVALLFVAHPIQTEAVTYVFQRFASLVSMFYLLSLVLYIKGRLGAISVQQLAVSDDNSPQPPLNLRGGADRLGRSAGAEGGGVTFTSHGSRFTIIWYLLSLLSAVLAMKTKENALTLPVVITLYEFLFFTGQIKARVLRLLPFLLTMLIIPMTIVGLDSTAGEIVSVIKNPASLGFEELSGSEYLFTQFRVIMTYIRLLFLPVNQNLDYDYPIYRSFFAPPVLLSFVALAAIFGVAVWLLYKSQKAISGQLSAISYHNSPHPPLKLRGGADRLGRSAGAEGGGVTFIIHDSQFTFYRLIAFGILWFFITLSVESSIIPIPTVIDEYRVYLPSVGFFLALVAGVVLLLRRISLFTIHYLRFAKVAAAVFSVIVLALSAATYARNTLWKDRVGLWEDMAGKSPNSRRALNNLGLAYAEKGWQEKAINIYRRCIVLHPSFPLAYANLGVAYAKTGQTGMAIENFEKAVSLDHGNVIAYANLARTYGEAGRLDKAVENYSKAIALKPYDGAAYQGLGTAYVMLGRLDDALAAYTKFVMLSPDEPEAYRSRGVVYTKKGDLNNARADFQKSCALGSNESCEYLKSNRFQ